MRYSDAVRDRRYPYRPMRRQVVEAWREQKRVHAGLLKEPDGYYSTPSIEGAWFSPSGHMEIIGYHPHAAPLSVLSHPPRAVIPPVYRGALEPRHLT